MYYRPNNNRKLGDAMKKLILTVVVVLLAAGGAFAAIFFLPKGTQSGSSSQPVSSAPSAPAQRYSLEQLVTAADTVITGSIIKADVENGGVLYTMNVQKVYKGRNYTSMGYAYLTGKQSLKIGQSYLFVGKTGTEEYHYFEPIAGVPWAFSVLENGALAAAGNGEQGLITDLGSATLQQVISYCDII